MHLACDDGLNCIPLHYKAQFSRKEKLWKSLLRVAPHSFSCSFVPCCHCTKKVKAMTSKSNHSIVITACMNYGLMAVRNVSFGSDKEAIDRVVDQ